MNSVSPPPLIKRRERQQTGDETNCIISFAGLEIRSVAAIVKNNEHTDQEESCQKCQGQNQPPGDGEGQVHEVPDERVRDEGICKLPQGAPSRRLLVLMHNLLPSRTV